MTNNHKQSQQSSTPSSATLTPEALDVSDITTVTALVASLPERLGIGQLVTARARQRMGNVHSVSPDAIAYALRLAEERGSPVRFDKEAARRYLEEEARLRPLREALAAAMARIDGHVLSLREKPVRNTFGLFNALKVQSTFDPTAETEIALDGLREKIPVARKRGSRKKKEPTEPLSDRRASYRCVRREARFPTGRRAFRRFRGAAPHRGDGRSRRTGRARTARSRPPAARVT